MSSRHPQWTRPFGFIYDNGLNFAKSIYNPTSVIRRILKVVDESPTPLTKVEILTLAGYPRSRKTTMVTVTYEYPRLSKTEFPRYDYKATPKKHRRTCKITTNTRNTTRGYLSYYFGGARKADFIRPVRQGRKVVWVKGENFPNLSKLVEVK